MTGRQLAEILLADPHVDEPIYVLNSQDEQGRPEFAEVNALATVFDVWTLGACDPKDIQIIGHRRRAI